VFVEVIATPSAQVRTGERFTLRALPLRVGCSRQARLRLGEVQADGVDVELADDGGPVLRSPAGAPRSSVNGVAVDGGGSRRLLEGDCVYVHPGLALEVRAQARVEARDAGLEAALALRDDEATWLVYRDLLEERGDPLADWLRRFGATTPAERLARLGPLADAVGLGLVEVRWAHSGVLEGVALSRQSVVGRPGLSWCVAQLSQLPVARFLRRLHVALFAGAAGTTDARFASADDEAAQAIDLLVQAPFAPSLRELTLGFVSLPHQWPRCAQALVRLQARAPSLAGRVEQVVRPGGQASVVVVQRPREVDVVSAEVVLNPARSDVGVAPGCQVRLVGDAPQVACTFHRQSDGQWVVFDEGGDPFRDAAKVDTAARPARQALRVNGVRTLRCALAPGDVVEPVEGLQLRFTLG
jgi:hypothetical protein